MWPFRQKRERHWAGQQVQFLQEHGWHQRPDGYWMNKDASGRFNLLGAITRAKVMYQTEQARERYNKNIRLFDPNGLIGKLTRAVRFLSWWK